jgi:adenylylsulfate kinase
MDSNSRSIAKAISYRLLGSISTGLIVLYFSGDMKISLGVGALDVVAKIGLYFLHERLWNYIQFGRQSPPDYEI